MSDEKTISNQYAHSSVSRHKGKVFTGLRHYKYSPDRVNIQVITNGVNLANKYPSKSKPIRVVSSCQLGKSDLKQYIKQLKDLLKEWDD